MYCALDIVDRVEADALRIQVYEYGIGKEIVQGIGWSKDINSLQNKKRQETWKKMNEMITIKGNEQDLIEEIEKAGSQYPVFMRDRVKDVFQATEEKQYEKAEGICCELLDYAPVPEIQMLLGTCYFVQGKMPVARQVFSDLLHDHPEEKEYRIYYGMTEHALGRYEEAVKELGSVYPLSEYYPFYYTSYGDSLQQIGRLKQSCDIFREEAVFFKKTGTIVSAGMLDGAFQNLLYLDIVLGNGKYPEDIVLYYDFLNQVEMTPEMQDDLAGNIVYFCSLMSNKWYRPLFLEFISYIRDKGFLTKEDAMLTLASAFSSWESYSYHEDSRLSALMETYLNASHRRKYSKIDMLLEEEQDEIDVTALTYDWYMCRYAAEYPEELDYVRNHYPYSYEDNRDFLEMIKDDAEITAAEVLDKLYAYARNTSRREFEESMNYAYKKACEEKKEPAYVYEGNETYRGIQPKAGRNDPCPCGSGKKYKKCCGR